MKKLGIILIVSVFSFGSAMAQLIKVDQEVFGMDCAPCAYGLERGLKKMEGLESVQVSLNDGKAYIKLSTNNTLTLQKIQKEVKNNGFSARNAEVVLLGELNNKDNSWQIRVTNEVFLVSADTSPELLKALKPGKVKLRLLVKNKDIKEVNDPWAVQIIEVF